jgi:hypothetical protein
MDNRKSGRVVGIIHPLRAPPPRTPAWPGCNPQPLRLVARPDKETARVVENGLALYACKGHIAAIDYFAAQGHTPSLYTIATGSSEPIYRQLVEQDPPPGWPPASWRRATCCRPCAKSRRRWPSIR